MSFLVVAPMGLVVGFVSGRWWSVGLGLVGGLLVLGVGIVSTPSPLDTPAVFVALVAAATIAIGVAARHRMPSRAE